MEGPEPPKGFEGMPAEILEMIFNDSTLNERLRMRAVSKILYKYLTPKIAELVKPEECVISMLNLSQLKNSIHTTLTLEDVGMAQHLLELETHSTKAWKRKHPKKNSIECFFTFPYAGPIEFAFFERAHIEHLNVDKRIPFHLNSASMSLLKRLLRGCTIGKLSLVFEAETIQQIIEVSELASLVRAKHVEFIIQNSACDREFPSRMREIAMQLVAVGVEEVTMTADSMYGKYCGGMAALQVDFDLIGAFLKAGISKFTFDAEFGHESRRGERGHRKYEKFMKKLSRSGKRVRILIRSRCLELIRDGETFRHRPHGLKYVTTVFARNPNILRARAEALIAPL